jgi:hypothetical protein
MVALSMPWRRRAARSVPVPRSVTLLLQLTERDGLSRTCYRSRQELAEVRVVLDELVNQFVVFFEEPYRDQARCGNSTTRGWPES